MPTYLSKMVSRFVSRLETTVLSLQLQLQKNGVFRLRLFQCNFIANHIVLHCIAVEIANHWCCRKGRAKLLVKRSREDWVQIILHLKLHCNYIVHCIAYLPCIGVVLDVANHWCCRIGRAKQQDRKEKMTECQLLLVQNHQLCIRLPSDRWEMGNTKTVQLPNYLKILKGTFLSQKILICQLCI